MNRTDAQKELERENLILLQNAVSLAIRYEGKMEEFGQGKTGQMVTRLAKTVSFAAYAAFDESLQDPGEQTRLLLAVPEVTIAINSALWNAFMMGYDHSQQEQMARFTVAEE